MRIIEKRHLVKAGPAEVWQALTTNDGIRSFFAPDSDVSLAIGGKYEIFFNHHLPYGERGSEGCRILSYLPLRMLSFSWNAPPAIPALRAGGEYTWVVIQLDGGGGGGGSGGGDGSTTVGLSHLIPHQGGDWDRYYAYFDSAWDVVLGRLKLLFETGPVDWSARD